MDATTIVALVVGVPLLAYHLYVAYLTERANLSGGAQVLAVVALTSLPLLGAVLVHGYIFGKEEQNKKTAPGGGSDRKAGSK
jgi:hypothetical protein